LSRYHVQLDNICQEARLRECRTVKQSLQHTRYQVELGNELKASGGGKLEFLSTHPAHQTRIDALRQQMNYALQLSRQSQAGGWQPNCHL